MAKKQLGTKPARNPVLDHLPTTSFQPAGSRPEEAAGRRFPLPVGNPIAAEKLTEFERNQLEQIGWKEGDPVPGNMADLIEEAKERANREASDVSSMPPPAAPDMPPLQMPEVTEIDQLPEHEQQRLSEALKQAGDQYESMQGQQGTQFPEGAPDSVRAAAQNRVDRTIDISIEDDTKGQREQQSQPSEQPKKPASVETTDSGEPHLCPNCGWDQSQSDTTPEPSREDIDSFLVATLGGKPWTKLYDLLGGKLQVHVRQLRPYEIDACYKQVHYEREKDDSMQLDAHWEQLMRYRLCLQLVEIRSGEDIASFPSELKDWQLDLEGPTQLPSIEKQVYAEAIPTESMNRIIASVIGKFSRTLGKLEVEVENPNFWNEASSPA